MKAFQGGTLIRLILTDYKVNIIYLDHLCADNTCNQFCFVYFSIY